VRNLEKILVISTVCNHQSRFRNHKTRGTDSFDD